MLLAFRRIFGRAGLEEKDVRILTGMFRQIEWYAKEGWKVVEEKEKKGRKIRSELNCRIAMDTRPQLQEQNV